MTTLLYRSPDVVINEFQWHLVVEARNGKACRFLRWRPAGKPGTVGMWRPFKKWVGHKPKAAEFKLLEKFKPHARLAERGYVAR